VVPASYLAPVPLVSHLDPRLQHACRILFENVHPLVIFGSPCSENLTTGLPQGNREEPYHHLDIENFCLTFFYYKNVFLLLSTSENEILPLLRL